MAYRLEAETVLSEVSYPSSTPATPSSGSATQHASVTLAGCMYEACMSAAGSRAPE